MIRNIPAISEDKSEIDLTPMLDVVFILLIFFVVTATFIRDFGIPVTLPATLTEPTTEIESIVVTVEEGSSFRVNGRALAPGSLAPYIMSLHVENPEAGFVLQVAQSAFVEDTVLAADAARQAGFDVIPIAELANE